MQIAQTFQCYASTFNAVHICLTIVTNEPHNQIFIIHESNIPLQRAMFDSIAYLCAPSRALTICMMLERNIFAKNGWVYVNIINDRNSSNSQKNAKIFVTNIGLDVCILAIYDKES